MNAVSDIYNDNIRYLFMNSRMLSHCHAIDDNAMLTQRHVLPRDETYKYARKMLSQ